MTETPDAAMLMSMVRDSSAGFVDPKWDELLALVDDQANAIERVRELHKPFGENNEWCDHCEIGQNSGYDWADYPCDTIKALDGDTE